MLTNIMRDMDLFGKVLVYAGTEKTAKRELYKAEFVTLVFSISKILISKIYEAWVFMKKEEMGKEKTNFSANLLEQWEKIETFFSDKKNKDLFAFVRHNFGFHFGYRKNIEPCIENAMKEVGDLEFWLGNDSSWNNIFSGSNAIMPTVLLHRMTELKFVGS